MNRGQARKLRKNPTDAEKVLWKHLRLRQVEGHKFRRQQPLGPYIVDFVCLDRKLIVEVDGGQHLEQSASEARRTASLEARGFRVLRFWNDQVLKDLESVKEVIWQVLMAPPTLSLPLQGGGGKRLPGQRTEPWRNPVSLKHDACGNSSLGIS